jgi:NACalpha-BTF3-like transcription factor
VPTLVQRRKPKEATVDHTTYVEGLIEELARRLGVSKDDVREALNAGTDTDVEVAIRRLQIRP